MAKRPAHAGPKVSPTSAQRATESTTSPPKPAVAPIRTAGIRVEATRLGYYDHVRRRPGDVFTIAQASDFSRKWMRRVDADTPERITTPNQALAQQHDEILAMRHTPPSEANRPGIQVGPDDVSDGIPTGTQNPLGDFDDEA
jgi:hypothetical protein